MTDQKWIIDTVPSRRFPVYTRLNANDVMPDPITPLAASLVWTPEILPGWASGYVRLDSFTPEEMSGEEYAPSGGFFYGYLYVNMTTVRVIGVRAGIGSEGIDAAFFTHPNPPPHKSSPSDINETLSAKMAGRVQWTLTTTAIPELEEEREFADRIRAQRPDLTTCSNEVLVTWARSLAPVQRLFWGRGYVIASNQAALGPGIISSLVGAADPSLAIKVIGSAGDVDSALPSYALWDLSRQVRSDAALSAEFDKGDEELLKRLEADHPGFATKFRTFLHEFGYRGPSEWDIGMPSWETQPELPLALIGRLRHLDDDASPALRKEQRAAEAAEALQKALEILGDNAEAVQTLHLAIGSARRFAAWRERGKSNAVKVLNEIRVALYELGRRLVANGELDDQREVFMALESELDVLTTHAADLRDTLRAREEQWKKLFDVVPPDFVVGGEPMPLLSELMRKDGERGATVRPGDVLTGAPASAGVARGRARVVRDMSQIASFEPGEILVAPQTDPSWTPLFMVSAGVVVDVGAMGSHAMIVSRELGIPCAAGVSGATSRIPDGTLLEVDGSTGTVTVLEG
ncbi:MAG TPA: PEP-utilizing enzyme [Kribbellaceae bacterium]